MAVATDVHLAAVLWALWPWLLLDDLTMTAALELLCIYTANCTTACTALCSSGTSGSSQALVPKPTVSNSLMHGLMKLASSVAPDNTSIYSLAFSLLANLALSRDGKGLLLKSNFLQHFLSVPVPRAGGRSSASTGDLLTLWLRLLLNVSFGEDGQQMILRLRGALEMLVELAMSKQASIKHSVLLILHNICFCSANKPKVLANGSSSSEIQTIGASALWALLHNNQKAKSTLKCPSIKLKVEEAFMFSRNGENKFSLILKSFSVQHSDVDAAASGMTLFRNWDDRLGLQTEKAFAKGISPSKMEAVQKDYWYFVVLLMLICVLRGSRQMKAPESTVSLQEGMILDCLCPWSGQLIMVSWSKKSHLQPIAVYHPQYGTNFGSSFDGRVEFLKSSEMDGSISIVNVTEADIGQYHCSLQTYPQGSWTKDTFVRKAALTTTTTIIPIQADTKLVVAEKDNLTIICDLVHNGEVYQVSIEKVDTMEGVGNIIATCQLLEGAVELQNFSSRGRVNCSEAMELRLQLTSIAREDGGLYRYFSGLHHMLYVYVGGGLVGLAALLIVLLKCVNRLKRKREEYSVKLHPAKRKVKIAIKNGSTSLTSENQDTGAPFLIPELTGLTFQVVDL
ncbi:hypothetical protein DNTS_008489 [Danionella cerebrum]|uniref:Ig-like domain-containing protein n=1 Tax=Danionella cerebrum TaxID=2873325 RepID=A0A553MRG3_9TELE|nr:hypothetical protein DNTS_008489 [Danionella translucida]